MKIQSSNIGESYAQFYMTQ